MTNKTRLHIPDIVIFTKTFLLYVAVLIRENLKRQKAEKVDCFVSILALIKLGSTVGCRSEMCKNVKALSFHEIGGF